MTDFHIEFYVNDELCVFNFFVLLFVDGSEAVAEAHAQLVKTPAPSVTSDRKDGQRKAHFLLLSINSVLETYMLLSEIRFHEQWWQV